MSITLDSTLADVVTERPDAAPTLESFGLDYCCKGQRSLGDACRDAGVDPATVLDRIEGQVGTAGTAGDDWPSLAPAQLVDHIVDTHHAYLHAELPRLRALLEKVVGVHGGRHRELRQVEATFRTLQADLEPHLQKEELILFPMIAQLAAPTASASTPVASHCGSVANPVAVMVAEHERDGEVLAELRRLTGGYTPPTDACASFRALYAGLAELEADTHLHIHKENNVLFPAVLELSAATTP